MSTYTFPSECRKCGQSLQRHSLYGNQYVECSCTKVDVPTTISPFIQPVPTVPSMTLRDWFAGQAMQGLLACGEADNEHTSSVTAAASYRIADAMLAAREVKP